MVKESFGSVFFQLSSNTLPEMMREHRSIACGYGLGSGYSFNSRDCKIRILLHFDEIQAKVRTFYWKRFAILKIHSSELTLVNNQFPFVETERCCSAVWVNIEQYLLTGRIFSR